MIWWLRLEVWGLGLVGEDLADGGGVQAGPGAEFINGDELVVLLVEAAPDDVHDLAAMALTAASDELNVFGVNAEPGDALFHGAVFVFIKVALLFFIFCGSLTVVRREKFST